MRRVRVIPVILVENGRAVVTIGFQRRIYIGDPINAIRILNDKEVDELIILDISSKKTRRSPDFNLIYQMASESFMPLAYGGFLNTMDDVERVIKCGVEKVSFNTSLFERPALIRQVAQRYGKQSVIASVDVKKNWLGRWVLATDGGKKSLKGDTSEIFTKLLDEGVGEILLNAIAKDGTMQGYDLKMIEYFSKLVSIPLIACGGAGSLDDFRQAVEVGASAVAAAAMFSFKGGYNSVLINYPEPEILHKRLFSHLAFQKQIKNP